ncbi:ArsR/SmtB family transcription factor [Humibacter ginsenosidimutans]|uniref:Winged helix-turn-helix transcriptional regulator n=1 Tax=Humibacter ginsenosidimutans TaxID=2599293 RepID=A0A5B8M799_9MICO|nr:metalloregulator ArsR/SmtB family transcription factor [Humibacter ginsenosidimutans]QDZ15320.1 winged helix-turn-helix transcriptional regulator [Humibacter ginsenosidimutans]
MTEAAANDPLSTVFFALADPTRRAILARLTDGPATIGELAAPFRVSLATVSRHITVLEQAGLVGKQRNAQWRTVHLESAQLQAADDWLAPYRAFFERRFDALETHLKSMKTTSEEPS